MTYSYDVQCHPVSDFVEALYVQTDTTSRYREVLLDVISADHIHEGFCCQAYVDACDLLSIGVHDRCCG